MTDHVRVTVGGESKRAALVSLVDAASDGAADSGATTSVASTTSATTLKAANTARIGLTIFNDDANDLYVLLGTGTVSATVYTVKLVEGAYYETPYGFTGIVTGVWAGDGSGSARVTEIS